MRNTLKHKRTLLIAMTVLLAACGGGGNDAPPPPPTPPVTVIDAFTSFVRNLLASLSENTEPVAVTDVAVTASETNEPEPVN